MANRIEDLLEPGERVVHREPSGWNRRLFWPFLLSSPVYAGVLALGFLRLDAPILFGMAGMVIACLAIGLVVTFSADDRSRESLITDRRVLHKTRREGQETVTEIPPPEVVAVELVDAVFGLSVIIEREGGQENRFSDLRRPQDFAIAVAKEAKLPGPALVGRLELLAMYCFSLGGVASGGYFIILFTRHVSLSSDIWMLVQVPLVIVLQLTGLVLATWLGMHLAGLLAVALMPVFASAEQARNWLRMRPQGRLARWMLWKHPIHFKLASLVFGRPLTPIADRVENHGG